MSGFTEDVPSVSDAFAAAYAAGIPISVAAGNKGEDINASPTDASTKRTVPCARVAPYYVFNDILLTEQAARGYVRWSQ
jgi:hypothetical protein